MSFLKTLDISASGLTAQRMRMDTISQNIANIDTTRTEDGTPYRRKQVVLQERELNFQTALDKAAAKSQRNNGSGGVRVKQVVENQSDFIPVYDPSHPDADEDGYVQMPNVDRMEETVDMMAASHSYDANITALNVVKAMAMKAAEITK